MVAVEHHFDFGSPNSYLAWKIIPDIEKRTGATFVNVPILLGGVFKLTGNQPPMVAFGNIKNKPQYENLEMQRFIARHKLRKFKFNSHFPVNTVQIMRGAVAADMDGVLAKYMDIVFRAMWEDSKKMDDADVIREVLDAGGLDGARILARIQDQDVKDTLLSNTSASVERGTFGAPTFYVADEIFFGKDRLRDVEEEIVRATA
ncbi:2-hydroxychromene-2-carboxylate isomerase [Parvibaculum sedimenti]|uniref:2-hydroxychromene-2-carboxylate isomerase n=1 Tax=Parvibaculum sedimenti TaxID=2608632 RepID=A0A6N6VDG6_9HYPH|nr:2-hydroxychromene-2-carboxylate isomerase [Parvibaculum sedimenti]KAB7738600.1 2-hydroxychromene-2-carboxylate isomerase [Parvibaculum sedimenti]